MLGLVWLGGSYQGLGHKSAWRVASRALHRGGLLKFAGLTRFRVSIDKTLGLIASTLDLPLREKK